MVMDQTLYMTFSYPHMDSYDLEHIHVLWTLCPAALCQMERVMRNAIKVTNPMKPCMHAPTLRRSVPSSVTLRLVQFVAFQ
jgi:hypothetical protein